MTSCFRLAVACLLGVWTVSGCYRKNPVYCDQYNPCASGNSCIDHECEPGSDGSVADMSRVYDFAMSLPRDMSMQPPDQSMLVDQSMQPPDQSMPDMSIRCVRNFQCPGSACDDDLGGACHPKTKVLVVSDAAGCRTMGMAGTEPYCSLTDALTDPGLGSTYDVLLIQPSTKGGYDQLGYTLEIATTVRLVGARTKASDPAPVEVSPLEIKHGAAAIQVGIEDLHLTPTMSGSTDAIFCHRTDPGDPAITLSVRWSEISSTPLYGIDSEACGPVRLVSNNIHDNGAGVTVTGPATAQPLIMVDNFVVNSTATGFSTTPKGAVAIQNFGATGSTIAFNTLWGNTCPSGSSNNNSCNLYCTSNQPTTSYSLISNPTGGKGIAANCVVTNSLVPSNYTSGAGANNLTGITPDFVNAPSDYHLNADATDVKLRVATPMSLPFPYDIDFDARPQPGGVAGGVTYPAGVDIGADQLVP